MTTYSPSPLDLARVATGRTTSLFFNDYSRSQAAIAARLRDARVLLIGGAGSIGGSVARLLATHEMAALHVVDISENSLVELTRDLRARAEPLRARDVRWLPLDFGDDIMRRFLHSEQAYDYVLNFAAIKHVRSEKDTLSVLRMLETNVLKQARLLQWLNAKGRPTAYFSVSTDKAANPVNLMGASKRLMEHVMFSLGGAAQEPRSSARFANVAFSDGSLLQSWQLRLAKGQPLASPVRTRRYFVSLEEAGQLCVLAAFQQQGSQLLVPRLVEEHDMHLLDETAAAFLRAHGFEPERYSGEAEAIAAVERDRARGRYPLLLTPLDTSGEKAYEEFVGAGETAKEVGFESIQGLDYVPLPPERQRSFVNLITAVTRFIAEPSVEVSKGLIVELVTAVLPEFRHVDATRHLDERV